MNTFIKPLIKLQVPTDAPIAKKYVHVSIDPGSHHCGIAIFDLKGKYLDSFTVHVSEGIIATMRLHQLRLVFEKTWKAKLGESTVAVLCTTEQLPPGAKSVLTYAAGAVLSSGFISAELPTAHYVPVQTWKAFVRGINPTVGQTPKGKKALEDIGWEYPMPDTDDAADAILIYLAYVWKARAVVWLGERKWINSSAGLQARVERPTFSPALTLDTPQMIIKNQRLRTVATTGSAKKKKAKE